MYRLILARALGRRFSHVVLIKQHVCCRIDAILAVEDLIVGLDPFHHALDLAVYSQPLDRMFKFVAEAPEHMPIIPLIAVRPFSHLDRIFDEMLQRTCNFSATGRGRVETCRACGDIG